MRIDKFKIEFNKKSFVQQGKILDAMKADIDQNLLPDGAPASKRPAQFKAFVELYNELRTARGDCSQCGVSLNKDGKCPSCEQDRADQIADERAGK